MTFLSEDPDRPAPLRPSGATEMPAQLDDDDAAYPSEEQVQYSSELPSVSRLDVESVLSRNVRGTVICANLLCIGFETDFPGPYWVFVNACFSLWYFLELAVRVHENANGLRMFIPCPTKARMSMFSIQSDARQTAALLDIFELVLVVLSILDIAELLKPPDDTSKMHLVVKTVHLLRFLRVFRLFEVLTRFVVAVGNMLRNLVWIFAVIGLVSYVCAVYLTQYVQTIGGELEKDAKQNFQDVLTSLFSLFQVTTMDNWSLIAAPLVRHGGRYWMVFFVLFIAFTSWTMISLLTAVVSDTIIMQTRSKVDEKRAQDEKRTQDFVRFLHQCFRHADADGNGVLDKEEFEVLIAEDVVTKKMEELGVVISREELRHTFDMLDVDESGELTIDEFTTGLSLMHQELSIKHVVAINYSLKRATLNLQRRIETASEAADEVMGRHFKSMDDNLADLDSQLCVFITHAGIHDNGTTKEGDAQVNDGSLKQQLSKSLSRSTSGLKKVIST